MSELPQMSTMGGSFVAPDGVAMGRSNVVDDPAERDETPNLRGQSSSRGSRGTADG
jgi:hypothetical protein